MVRIAFILIILVLGGCNSPDSPDCLKSRGSDTEETRSLSGFSSIEVRDYLEVKLISSSHHKVVIKGGENLLPKITCNVEEGTLIIDNKNRCNFVRSFEGIPEVWVYAPAVNNVVLQDGAGPFETQGVYAGDSLRLETNHASGDIALTLDMEKVIVSLPTGTSNVHLSGQVDWLEIFSDAYGSVNAENVEASVVLMNNSSINDFSVKTNNYFYAEINDRGNIYVSGNVIHSDISINGSGEVIVQD